MPSPRSLSVATIAHVVAAAFLLSTDDARACGGFFARGADVPALEVEQTLIFHDPGKQVEHFVRQVTFRKGNASFGFVVPTPTRPEVAKVDDPPFGRLGTSFPFRALRGGGGGGLGGIGSGGGSGSGGVEVLSKQKVGSFTVFVLAATDAGGLRAWLTNNRFETTPTSASWLEHYVKLHFFFVASRFDPPSAGTVQAADAGTAGGTATRPVHAETMRITFATPVPFYPYLEPDHPDSHDPRVLGVWLIAPRPATPVAAQLRDGVVRWKRPWLEGASSQASSSALKDVVGPSLAALLPPVQKAVTGEPEPELSVQVFEDQKTSRAGFGDVVFVPNAPVQWSEGDLAALRPFLSVLEPRRGTP